MGRKAIMTNLRKTVIRNNPEKFKGIKQVCKTEEEDKKEVNVVQVFSEMSSITDPAFFKMQKDIEEIRTKIRSLGAMEVPLQFRRDSLSLLRVKTTPEKIEK